jgi:hypothetical protein
MERKRKKKSTDKAEQNGFPGYPHYSQEEDIYSQSLEETEIDPEKPHGQKAPPEDPEAPNEKGFNDDVSGSDLDIPGAELDDAQENVGSEDEENNYYSLGGDNHENLEEDQDKS